MSLIDARLSEILVCPADHGDLVEQEAESLLVCSVCGRAFPVRGGIPIMLLDQEETPRD